LCVVTITYYDKEVAITIMETYDYSKPTVVREWCQANRITKVGECVDWDTGKKRTQ
jgi:hypothetical protein